MKINRYEIGKVRIEEGEANRKAIFHFLRENPGSKQIDAANHFGWNVTTVHRHVKAIRSGWRPSTEG